MPWIPIYADESDIRVLHGWVNDSAELAYIVSDGPGRWRAVPRTDTLGRGRHCLWHVPSGPLPLLHPHPSDRVDQITDPWAGWNELRAEGNGGRNPYFGAGHPGVFWLNCHPASTRTRGNLGMSSFEWIGNHYKVIGQPADPSTERFWNRLRGWIGKQSVKVPRSGPITGRGEVFAFPSALAKINAGAPRDDNPSM